jgi:hypothetical protein
MTTNNLAPRSENEIALQYGHMSYDALLQLRIEGGLTPEADNALNSEMRRRSLGRKDVDDMKDWEEQQKPPPPDPQRVVLGYGIRYVGRKFLTPDDESSGIFAATKFIVVRRVPMIPIGSYLIKPRESGLPEIESRVPLQWDQVWSGIWPLLLFIAIGLGLLAVTISLGGKR